MHPQFCLIWERDSVSLEGVAPLCHYHQPPPPPPTARQDGRRSGRAPLTKRAGKEISSRKYSETTPFFPQTKPHPTVPEVIRPKKGVLGVRFNPSDTRGCPRGRAVVQNMQRVWGWGKKGEKKKEVSALMLYVVCSGASDAAGWQATDHWGGWLVGWWCVRFSVRVVCYLTCVSCAWCMHSHHHTHTHRVPYDW